VVKVKAFQVLFNKEADVARLLSSLDVVLEIETICTNILQVLSI